MPGPRGFRTTQGSALIFFPYLAIGPDHFHHGFAIVGNCKAQPRPTLRVLQHQRRLTIPGGAEIDAVLQQFAVFPEFLIVSVALLRRHGFGYVGITMRIGDRAEIGVRRVVDAHRRGRVGAVVIVSQLQRLVLAKPVEGEG
ncbi:MAG TPA: hypothetical protein VF472_06650 [Burkholderiaceae bacterium]